jgi:hypothetical protein
MNTQSIIDSIRTGTWADAKAGVDQLVVLASTGDMLAAEWLARHAPWTRTEV